MPEIMLSPIVNGEYITFLDSDDYIDKQAYQKAYQFAKEKDYDIVMYDMVYFYPNGTKEIRPTIPNFLQKEPIDASCFVLSVPAACNKIFKREIWEQKENRFPVGLWYEDLATIPRNC